MKKKTPSIPQKTSTSPHQWLTSVGLLLLGGFVGLQTLWDLSSPQTFNSPPAISPHHQIDLSRLEQELAELRAELTELKTYINASSTSGYPVQKKHNPPPLHVNPSETDTLTQSPSAPQPPKTSSAPLHARPRLTEETTKAPQQVFSQFFNNQDIDVSWSSEQETNIRNEIGNGQLGKAHLVATECRSTICRVELSNLEHTDIPATMLAVMNNPSLVDRPAYITHDKERLTIYVARQGKKLPTVDLPQRLSQASIPLELIAR